MTVIHRYWTRLVAVVAAVLVVPVLLGQGEATSHATATPVVASGLHRAAEPGASGTPAVAPIDPAVEAHAVLHADGDLVVLGELADGEAAPDDLAAAKGGSGAYGSRTSGGFALIDGRAYLRSRYVIRLVPSPGIERVRSVLDRAAQAASATAPSIDVTLSGAAGNHRPGPGEIDVAVSSSSPCGGSWLACGGPVLVADGAGVPEIRSGKIWVHPRLLERSLREIDNTVHHELGHTLGLAHYNGTYGGERQVMHATAFDAFGFRAGDRNGLVRITENGPSPAATVTDLDYAAGAFHIGGSIEHADAVTALRVGIDGEAGPAVRTGNGRFNLRAPSDGGRHTVCLDVVSRFGTARARCATIDAPVRPTGTLDGIRPTQTGFAIHGWTLDPQTAEPIDVTVTVDGLGLLTTTADVIRPDIGRAFPRYGSRHGFDMTHVATPGRHRVCAVAENVGAGSRTTLGCAIVEVPYPPLTSSAAGILGA